MTGSKPRRLHRQDRLALIPLPKKSAADLSFDVELTYATPPAGEFGAGSLEVLGPRLAIRHQVHRVVAFPAF